MGSYTHSRAQPHSQIFTALQKGKSVKVILWRDNIPEGRNYAEKTSLLVLVVQYSLADATHSMPNLPKQSEQQKELRRDSYSDNLVSRYEGL